MSPSTTRSGLARPCGTLALAVSALLGLGCLGPQVEPASALKFKSYKAVDASFRVFERASETYPSGGSFLGEATSVLDGPNRLGKRTPIVLTGKKGEVGVPTRFSKNGFELIKYPDGSADACSGPFHESNNGGFISIKVRDTRKGLKARWAIPSGSAQDDCGSLYAAAFPDPLYGKDTVPGDIGDRTIVLKAKGSKTRTNRLTEQTLRWRGRVKLRRI